MNAKRLQNLLLELLNEHEEEKSDNAIKEFDEELEEVEIQAQTYEQAGILTMDAGLVISIGNMEYQVTIVRSR